MVEESRPMNGIVIFVKLWKEEFWHMPVCNRVCNKTHSDMF